MSEPITTAEPVADGRDMLLSLFPDPTNPLHLGFLGLAAFFAVRILVAMYFGREQQPEKFSMSKVVQPQQAIAKRNFTARQLSEFDGGDNDTPVYMAVRGIVYDVSKGRGFYGKGGPYENFAGRDASRGLALSSFDKEVLADIDGPLDNLDGLDKAELDTLDEWATFFAGKYVAIGNLVESAEVKTVESSDKKND